LACPAVSGMPCCPTQPVHTPEGPAAWVANSTATIGCPLSQCLLSASVQAALVAAPRLLQSLQAGPLLSVGWSRPLVRAHEIPPPQGPPEELAAAIGRHTYLSTLRLRI
jgi:hypothetical protein